MSPSVSHQGLETVALVRNRFPPDCDAFRTAMGVWHSLYLGSGDRIGEKRTDARLQATFDRRRPEESLVRKPPADWSKKYELLQPPCGSVYRGRE